MASLYCATQKGSSSISNCLGGERNYRAAAQKGAGRRKAKIEKAARNDDYCVIKSNPVKIKAKREIILEKLPLSLRPAFWLFA